MADHRKWADSQIAVLTSIGIDLAESQRSVNWVLDALPEGEDPAVWVPPAHVLDAPLDNAAIQDARVDWYASDSVPPRYKRLLDAVEDNRDG